MVYAARTKCWAAKRDVVQDMRVTAPRLAKPARVVLHLPSHILAGFCAEPLRLRQPARLTTR
jgi:hypothetical protein